MTAPSDASARLQHHLDGLQEAFRDLYPDGEILVYGNHQGHEGPDLAERFVSGNLDGALVIALKTAPLEGVAAIIGNLAKKRGNGIWPFISRRAGPSLKSTMAFAAISGTPCIHSSRYSTSSTQRPNTNGRTGQRSSGRQG